MKETILEMERYAEENNIPIIEVDSIKFIMKYIKLNNVKSVLELGTAIGYSAILMANATSTVEITTIEKDEKRYREAVKNVNKCGLDRRIECVYNDALEVNLAGHSYDLIFIDAAKGKNKEFLDKFKSNLNENGYIIIDNMDFHGLVGKSMTIEKRRLRSLVKKIENFIKYMEEQTEFKVTKIDKGDGLYLLERI